MLDSVVFLVSIVIWRIIRPQRWVAQVQLFGYDSSTTRIVPWPESRKRGGVFVTVTWVHNILYSCRVPKALPYKGSQTVFHVKGPRSLTHHKLNRFEYSAIYSRDDSLATSLAFSDTVALLTDRNGVKTHSVTKHSSKSDKICLFYDFLDYIFYVETNENDFF